MAHRIGRTPQLSQPSGMTPGDIRGLSRSLYIDSTDLRSRVIELLPKDGSEEMEGPLEFASYTTVNLPSAVGIEGAVVYDETLNQLVVSDGTNWIALVDAGDVRIRLTEDTTFSVGSGQTYTTLQAAWDDLCERYDLAGFTATLDLIDGTHAGFSDNTGATGPTGGGRVVINGNAANPQNVIVTDSDDAFSIQIVHSHVYIQNFELQSTSTGFGGCLGVAWNGLVTFGPGMRFGSCVLEHMHASSGGQINTLAENYSIVDDAETHASVSQGAQIRIMDSTVTLTGTPAFTQFAAAGDEGIFDARGTTFSGAATGSAFTMSAGGIILRDTNNVFDLPGNAEGTMATEARYDDIVGIEGEEIAAGSFPAAATVVVAIPPWVRSLYITVSGVSSNTAARHPIILASIDGGSSYPTGYSCLGFDATPALLIGDALVDMVTDVAAARSWDYVAWINGLGGGGISSRFHGVTDDFSAGVVSMQSFKDDLDSRITHIRFGWNGSGNHDGGTYSVRATS